MKKETVFLTTCAMSFGLLGCGSAESPNLNNFQNAALVHDCIDKTLKSHFNSKTVNFSAAKISGAEPSIEEAKSFAEVYVSSFGSKEDEINKYREHLNSGPNIFKSTVTLQDGKNSYKCNYMYSTNGKGDLQKLPFIYSVQKSNEAPLPYKNGGYIKPYHGFEYVRQYITPNHGVKLFSLTTEANLKPKSEQSGLANAINEILTNKAFSDQNFKHLGELVQANNAIELANYAVSGLEIPDFVPENPTYIVPVVVSKRIQNIGNYQADDIAVEKMDHFNQNRYVDPDTGIATHKDTLQQMAQEFGMNAKNVIIEHVDAAKMKAENIPDTLRVQTDRYTDQELKDAAINP
ncbi:hypothetical protein HCY52_08100 [Acinetobacter radioresistens]|uniref:hypothetical protein n=1 Tax=Acinetobacter radioresistens TaxID=40216 RepID=UPI002002C2C3|nr:hypothetical protein [Acinetobacter radioresistens]MCK4083776.1 hypothetical protein [Acinetobacter radioresistens]